MTVVVPLFNGARLVRSTLDSVLAQSYPNLGVLVLDDGSTDESARVAAESCAGVPGAHVLRDATNRGLARTLNDALGLAEGDYLLVIHQDCQLLGDGWIGTAVRLAESRGAAEVAGRAVHSVDTMESLEKLFWIIRAHAVDDRIESAQDRRIPLFSENKCDLFRISALRVVGGFPRGFREGGEDQALASVFADRGLEIAFTEELTFAISIGDKAILRRYLAKETSYGRQMTQVIRRVGHKALRRSKDGSLDPRLRNRIAGAAWIASTIVAAGVVLGLGALRFWPILLIPLALRWGQFTVRAAREASAYRLSTTDVCRAGFYGILADLSYALGLVEGATVKDHPSKPDSLDEPRRSWVQLD